MWARLSATNDVKQSAHSGGVPVCYQSPSAWIWSKCGHDHCSFAKSPFDDNFGVSFEGVRGYQPFERKPETENFVRTGGVILRQQSREIECVSFSYLNEDKTSMVYLTRSDVVSWLPFQAEEQSGGRHHERGRW